MVEDYAAVQCGIRQLSPDKTIRGVHFPAIAAALSLILPDLETAFGAAASVGGY